MNGLPLEEAFRILDAALDGIRLPPEKVPAWESVGRILAREERSVLDLPPFDKSAMDGYALPAGDARDAYRVAGIVAAGQPPPPPLRPDEAVKIMTGAPVPPGTIEVVMQEDTERDGDLVKILRHGAVNLCRLGEDVKRGDLLFSPGRRLGVVDAANLIACGVTSVEVARRPRVAVLSTGDEIVGDPSLLAPGKIMDSNGPMLEGLAARWGLDPVSRASVADEPGAIEGAVRTGLEEAELVVLSGGVSEGDYDFVADVLSRLGARTHFTRVAVKPGRPTTFASREGRFVFGLPGNPVSAYLMFHLFVLRAAASMTGAPPFLKESSLPLDRPFRRRKGERFEFVPARLTREGRVAGIDMHGSAHLMALADAEGFFAVPPGVLELAVGTPVDFLKIP